MFAWSMKSPTSKTWTIFVGEMLNLVFTFRLSKLLQEVGAESDNKTIIFVETKRKVEEILRNIKREG
jgi:superfamily II DNA/RNA helicase